MSLLTPSSTPSLACWLSHLFTFWHINIESTLCLVVVVGRGCGGRVGSVPHMISDSVHGVETCVVKNLAPAPDQMPSLSLQRLGAMQICVLQMHCWACFRTVFWIPWQILLKVSFSEYANVWRIGKSIQSMMECFPFHILFEWQFAPQLCVLIGVAAGNSSYCHWPAKHQIGGRE